MPNEVFDNGHDASPSVDTNATSVTVIHRRWCGWITVEPAILFTTIGASMSGSVLTQLLLVRSCEVTLGYTSDKCNIIVNQTESKEAHDIEDLVQPHVTILQMYKSIIEALVPIVLSLFVGSWSDLHGRKPLMMWPILGHGLHYVMLAILSSVKHLPPAYFLFASIPIACSGGLMILISGIYSYISDVTSTGKRAFRMGLIDASIYGGFAIGLICTSPLYNAFGKYGYLAVFSTSSILSLFGFLYLIFIPESVNLSQAGDSRGGMCSLFDFKLVVRMVSTCCKKRENYGRPIIFLIVIVLTTCILTLQGESAVVFLFTRHKLGWDLSKYMNFSGFTVIVSIIGSTAGMYIFSLKLKISDSVFAVGVFITKAVQTFLVAFTTTAWYLIAGSIVGALGGVSGSLCHSVLSKTVPQGDIGAVFALTSMVEAVAPLVAAPLYSLVYNATLINFPGTFFLLSASFFVLDIILLGIVVVLQRISSRQYSEFVNEEN